MIIITLLILTLVSKNDNQSGHIFSIHQVDGGGLQGLASTWRSHGISILLQDGQNLHMMMMVLLQGVNLMKQTGLLCFADEPQNPFVTSVLASFEKVKMRLSIIIIIILTLSIFLGKYGALSIINLAQDFNIIYFFRKLWSTRFTEGSSSKKDFLISHFPSRWFSHF